MGIIVAKPKGNSSFIVKEQAVGTPNGVLTRFETSKDYSPNTLSVFLNGVRERYASELGNKQFEFSSPPRTGFLIDVEYVIK